MTSDKVAYCLFPSLLIALIAQGHALLIALIVEGRLFLTPNSSLLSSHSNLSQTRKVSILNSQEVHLIPLPFLNPQVQAPLRNPLKEQPSPKG